MAQIKVNVAEEASEDGTGHHRHGTRYSKSRNNKNDGISFGTCRHLTCESCSHNFDTKDPVIVHLLRQSRNDNGTLKCPFCPKVLLEDGSSPIKGVAGNGANSTNKQKDASTIIPPKDNLSNKRKSIGSLGSDEGNAKKIISKVKATPPETTAKCNEVASKWKVAAIPLVRQPSLRVQQKRKLSSPVETATTTPHKKVHNPKPTPSTPVSTVKVLKKAPTESTPAAGLVPVRSDQVKHSYEMTYRQSHGKGSRGGMLGGHRNSRSGRTRTSDEDSRSSVETPLKVSVLINNNPYPSDKRLAVPRGKEFHKGDIRCPYCGFEAKSVREVQFHVNTHMPKSYPCEFCSHIYRSKQAVMNHTQKHHPNEYSNLKDQSSDINRSTMRVDMEADDQRSISNYSSSMTSDSTETVENFYEVNQSQESNLENNSNFPVTATYTSYYAPGVQLVPHGDDQAFFNSAVGALLVEQQEERDFFTVGQPRSVERVVEMANF